MPKTAKTPGSVLLSHMDKFQLNPFSLSKEINLSNASILQIIKGKGKISVSTALRLAKFFATTPAYWLDLQRETDLKEAAENKELSAILKGISKAKKPAAKPKAKKVKPLGKVTLRNKRQQAAKTLGAKSASRKPRGKAKTKEIKTDKPD